MSCGFGIWFDFSLLYNNYAYNAIYIHVYNKILHEQWASLVDEHSNK